MRSRLYSERIQEDRLAVDLPRAASATPGGITGVAVPSVVLVADSAIMPAMPLCRLQSARDVKQEARSRSARI